MDLFSHLNWYKSNNQQQQQQDDNNSKPSIPVGKLIVLTDTLQAEGSFIIHHLLQASSKQSDSGVCLLALNQSFYHYNSVGRKLGYNLQNENAKNKFSFINGMSSSPYSWIDRLHAQQMEEEGVEEEPTLDNISKGFQPFPITRLLNNQPTFSQFLQHIYTLFTQDHQKRLNYNPLSQTTFIIDNINILNTFNNLSNNNQQNQNNNNNNRNNYNLDILNLIQYLHSYVNDNQNCSIVVLFHSDCNDDDTFFKLLQYESDITIMVNSLQTGYSKDIDGQISFLQKNQTNHSLDIIQPIHYKVLDNQIKFFALGSRMQ
ncbi:UPF0405 family protein [Cavenderia fasciculata]|uniref:UPF0405 family protein n=1 Tax=Cavenderia fasciculata TaxID=261658 RepID=F4PMC8_CACFS|nr:UPF0405 family protein [Cavenderia fasciculata]EGG22778.1 UPF0405 family protein [Cavenderia fasciculata]|eukprot:XP_004360629.1 UPF0405 family protein [Cavenderia fasciculata]